MRQQTEQAGMISVESKQKLKDLAYESRLSMREVLESLINNAKIVRKEQQNS